MVHGNLRQVMVFALVLILPCLVSAFAEGRRNILWNSGFECGVGCGSWGVVRRVGPNVPELWHEGGLRSAHALNLVKPVGSRLYRIGDKPGKWRISLMAKRAAGAGRLNVLLTNLNYPGHKKNGVNSFQKRFTVTDRWRRFTFDADIGPVFRPYFHIELSGKGVIVDDIMLYPVKSGKEGAASYHAVQDIETGFVIPEITRIYVDGETRTCHLMVSNNTARRVKTKVDYSVYDVFEDPVRTETVPVDLAARETKRIPISLDDLKHGAYRLSSNWKPGAQQGDALVALLPQVKQDYGTRWGCNASLGPESLDFTIRMLKRLGMGFVSTQSTGQHVGGWHQAERVEGKYRWRLDVVKKLKKNDIEPVLYMYALRWPKWVAKKYGDNEDKIVEAYGRYVYNLVKTHSPYVKYFVVQDETERQKLYRDRPGLYPRLHVRAYEMAKKAAKENGDEILVSTNTVDVGWYEKLWDKMGAQYFDFLSANFTPLPSWTARLLTRQAARKSDKEVYITPAVGQKCVMRQTSLICDRAVSGVNPSTFVWQTLKTSWLSRPYGLAKDVFSPTIHFGFYEIRVHDVAHYIPRNGWTALECDNSPHAGFQAVACMRYILEDMKPLRKAKKGIFSDAGIPIPNSGGVEAFPFRNDDRAVVAIMPGAQVNLDGRYRLRVPDGDIEFFDFFANKLASKKQKGDLVVNARAFPVYVRMPAGGLGGFLADLGKIRLERVKAPELTSLKVGPFVINVDRKKAGVIEVLSGQGRDLAPIVSGILAEPALRPDRKITVQGNAFLRNIRIQDRVGSLRRVMDVTVDRSSIRFAVSVRNPARNSGAKGHIRLLLGKSIAGKGFKYYQSVAKGRAQGIEGGVWHDLNRYDLAGRISGAAKPLLLNDGEAKLEIEDCIDVLIDAAAGQRFKTDTPPGFAFIVRGGQAYLESSYELGKAIGMGSRGHARFAAGLEISMADKPAE